MPVINQYLTGLKESFSTFLSQNYISGELKRIAEELYLELLDWKDDYTHWSPQEVRQFLDKSKLEPEKLEPAAKLLIQFVKEFPPHQANVFLHEYLLAVKQNGCSAATIRNYRSDIRQFIRFSSTGQLEKLFTKPVLAEFVHSQLDKGLKKASVQRKFSSISQYGWWLETEGLITHPMKWLFEITLDDLIKTNTPVKAETQLDSLAATSTQPLFSPGKTIQAKNKPSPLDDQVINFSIKKKFRRLSQKIQQALPRQTQRWLLPYLNLGFILLVLLGLGFFGYNQLFVQTDNPLAYPTSPVAPERVLSFQGRLTDTNQNPITTSSAMRFYLYNDLTSTNPVNQLWDSTTCNVTPDQDGIFTVNLGDDCGGTIDDSVFTENSNIWLEAEIETETLTPRQPIRTVAYAINAETVQGYPVAATGSATTNTIVTMNDGGQIVLGEVGPKIKSVSGNFTLEGETLTLQTPAGSNGDIVLDPDGTGAVSITGNATVSGNLTAGGQVQVGRFAVDPTSVGNGSLIYNTTDTSLKAYIGGSWQDIAYGAAATQYWQLNSNILSPIQDTYDFGVGGTTSAAPLFFDESAELLTLTNTTGGNSFRVNDEAGDTTPFVIDAGGNVGIGTTTPTGKLHIAGNINDQQLIVQGFSTQTLNLTEWKNSSDTLLASISPTGAGTFSDYKFLSNSPTSVTTISNNTLLPFMFGSFADQFAFKPVISLEYDTDGLGSWTAGTAADAKTLFDGKQNTSLVVNPASYKGFRVVVNAGTYLAPTLAIIEESWASPGGSPPISVTFESSSDNINWTSRKIFTANGSSSSSINHYIELNNHVAEKYWRISVVRTDTGTQNLSIFNIQLLASTNQSFGAVKGLPFTWNYDKILSGGDSANNDLQLQGTTHATRTSSYVILQPNGGNVGIGTTSPGYLLDVAGTASVNSLNINDAFTFPTADGSSDQVLATDGSGTLSWASVLTDGPSVGGWTHIDHALYPDDYWADDLIIGGNATGSAKFQVFGNSGNISTANNTIDWTLNNAVDALNFDSDTLSINALNNRVGIGTAAPTKDLQILKTSTPTIGLKYSTGQLGATDNVLGSIDFGAIETTGGQDGDDDAAASIKATTDFLGWSSSTEPAALTFWTTPAGSTTASEKVRISGSGNVGIGTTSPGAKLSFATGTSAADGIDFGGDTPLYRYTTNTLKTRYLYPETTNAYSLGSAALEWQYIYGTRIIGSAYINSDYFARYSTNNTSFFDSTAGNPQLRIYGNDGAYKYGSLQVDTNGAFNILAQTGEEIKFGAAGSVDLTIDTAGQVGIGTTSPTQKLDVTGNATASGNLTTGGQVQVGRFASNPASVGNGSLIYNTTDDSLKGYIGGSWQDIAYGAAATQYWQLNSNILSPIQDTYDFGVGGTTSAAPLFFDESAELLTLTNTTGGNSFVVNDEASDASPFVIDADGNVGVGLSTVSNKLAIKSAGTSTTPFKIEQSSSSNPLISVYETATAGQLLVGSDGAVGGYVNTYSTTAGMYTSLTGNMLTFYRNNASYISNSGGTSGSLIFRTKDSSSDVARLTLEGGDGDADAYFNNVNLGIGTASPEHKLDVYGDQRITGGTLGIGASPVSYYGIKLLQTATDAVIDNRANSSELNVVTTSPNSQWNVATFGQGRVHSSSTGNVNTLIAGWYQSQVDSTSAITANNIRGFYGYSMLGSSSPATIVNAIGAMVGTGNHSSVGGTISSSKGLIINTPIATGTITSNTGLQIDNQIVASTNNWAIRTYNGSIIFNESGDVDTDFRVEGDTDSDLLFVDAGNDLVQLGKLNINGAFTLPTADGTSGYVLATNGSGDVSWTSVLSDSPSVGAWTHIDHALYPDEYWADDLIIGGNSSASAKLRIAASGNIDTSNNTIDWTLNNAVDALNFDSNTLSIDASNNRVGIGDATPDDALDVVGTIDITTGNTYQINDTDVLSATTLGTSVVTSSLTTVGTLDAGAISSGFGAIDIGADNLTAGGTITFAGLTPDRLVTTTTGGQLTNSISSANLALSVSDETGSGLLVFGTSPTFTTDLTTPAILSADDLAITPAGGDVSITGNATASGNLTAGGQVQVGRFAADPTSVGNGSLIYNTTDTSLKAYIGGSWQDIAYGAAATQYWQLNSNILSPIQDTYDFSVGGTTLVSPFSVDESANTVRIGEGSNSNAVLNMYSSAGDTGAITYDTNDGWDFSGGHVSMGDSVGVSSTNVLTIGEDYNLDSSSIQSYAIATITSPTLTATADSYGYFSSITNNKTEDLVSNFHSNAYGGYFYAQSTGSSTFGMNVGVRGMAYNNSNAADNLDSLYGGHFTARNINSTSTVSNILGSASYAQGSTTAAATSAITNAYGYGAFLYPYNSDFGTAYGVRSYVTTNNGYDGDITNAYAIRGEIIDGSDDGGDITNAYGGSFSISKAATSPLMAQAYGISISAAGATTTYGAAITTTDTAPATNYGLYINSSGATGNSYGILGVAGDWFLQEDGDGAAGGTGAGGDLLLGASADLRLYHNGTNSYITNATGDLYIGDTGTDDVILSANGGNVGIGTTSPGAKLDIAGSATISATLSLAPYRQVDAGACGASSEGKMYYDASQNAYYYCDGSTWTEMGSGGGASTFLGLTDTPASYTAGSVLFTSGSAVTQDNANFFWDNTAKNLGIGTDSPLAKLHIVGSADDEQFIVQANSTQTANIFEVQDSSSNVLAGTDERGIIFSNGGTGVSNFFAGDNAGNIASTGLYNVGVGSQSLQANTSGEKNTASGMYSLYSNTSGSYNTAHGYVSLYTNNGSYNAATGYASLYNNTTGSNNTASGYLSLYTNTTGSNNTALGYESGRFISGGATANQTSTTSLYLGANTKALASGDTNEIVIGYNATGIGSNTVTLGNDSITTTALKGQVGIGTTSPGAELDVVGDIYVSSGISTYGTAVSDGAIEAAKFCTGDGETNCVTDFSTLMDSKWTNVSDTYVYPTANQYIGNNASGTATGKITGMFLADNAPLTFGNDNDATISFDGTYLDIAGIAQFSANHVYFAGGTTYYVSNTGNAVFNDIVALDTGNPGITIGDGSTGSIKIGSSTIFDANDTYLGFDPDSDAVAEMVVTNAGNVGIGVIAPTSRLEIGGSTSTISNAAGDITFNAASNVLSFSGDSLTNFTQASGSAGTVALPTYSFQGDADTGMYAPSANTLGFATAGTLRANFDSSGHLLPGTDDTYNLGSNTYRWQDLYLGPSTLHIGTSTTDEYTLSYNTTSNYLGFNVNGSGDPEIVFDSSGKVGIGTTTPTAPLHISGTQSTTLTHAMSLNPTMTNTNTNIGIGVTPTQTSISSWASFGIYNVPVFAATSGGPQNAFYGIANTPSISAAAAANVSFGVGGLFRVDNLSSVGSVLSNAYGILIDNPTATGTITNNYGLYIQNQTAGSSNNYSIYSAGGKNYFAGNVGIGTTAPNSLLSLKNGTYGGLKLDAYSGAGWSTSYGIIQAGNAEGTTTTDLALNPSGGDVAIGTTNPLGFKFYIEDDASGASGAFVQYVHNASTDSTADGIVIDIEAAAANSGNMFLYFQDGGGGIGSVNGNGTGVAYNTTSDARLKNDLGNYENALETVNHLRPLYYEMKDTPGISSVGFLAQELYQYYPYAVSGTPDSDPLTNPMQVDYSKLTPLLTAAIKEQQLQIEDLGQIYLDDTGSVVLTKTGTTYTAFDTATSQQLTGIVGLLDAVIANLRVGSLKVQEMFVGEKSLAQYIRDIVQLDLDSGNLVVSAPLEAVTPSPSPIVETTHVEAETASFSGEVTAESARLQELEVRMAEVKSIRATTAEFVDATVSGTLYATKIEGLDDQVASALNKSSFLSKLLEQKEDATASARLDTIASVFSTLDEAGFATDSATLAGLNFNSLSSVKTDVALNASAVFIDQYFAVNGSGWVAQQLGVGEQLIIGNSLAMGNNFIEFNPLNSTEPRVLHIQPSGEGTLSLLAGLMTLTDNGQVLIDGNLAVAGNLEVGDTLLTDLLAPTDWSQPLQVKLATGSGQIAGAETRFEIINQNDDPTATISAQGRGSFAQGIQIGTEDLTQISTQSATVESKQPSGKATVRKNTAGITIKSQLVTNDSLIYVSPIGSTNNQVLYVKAQSADNPQTLSNEGGFTVGFDQLASKDIQFNWWIVN